MLACPVWMAALDWRASPDRRDPKVTEAAPARRVSEAKMVWGCLAHLVHLVPLDRSSLSRAKISLWWLCPVQRADQVMPASRAQWDRKETGGRLVPRAPQG